MIRNEVGDNIIMKIVNINEEELEKIKKRLNSRNKLNKSEQIIKFIKDPK